MGLVPKFLILRFSSIGDIVLTTPVMRCLKKQMPAAEIHYVTRAGYASVLEHNPYITKLHLVTEENESELIHHLKTLKFDYIIDLHHNIRTLRYKIALYKAKSFSFDKLNIEKWLLTTFKINKLPVKHIVDRYLDTLQSFKIKNDEEGLDFFIGKKDIVPKSDLPLTHLHGYIAIAIGAAYATKQIPVEKLKALCAEIDHPIILLGGKEDFDRAHEVDESDTVKIYNACGKFNLAETAYLIQESSLLITPDTGLMHIAAAFKKRIVTVWGNTVPLFGMYPYYGRHKNRSRHAEVPNLPCRPCSKIGHNACPKKHFNCMQLQSVESIAAMAEELLTIER